MKIRLEHLKWFISILLLLMLLSLLCGCKTTKYIPVTITEYKDRYIHKTDTFVHTDSVWLHDSVSVLIKGDTVYNERWHYKDRYKYIYKNKTDTLVVKDSVPYKVYVEIDKAKKSTAKHGAMATWKKILLVIPIAAIAVFFTVLFIRKKWIWKK